MPHTGSDFADAIVKLMASHVPKSLEVIHM